MRRRQFKVQMYVFINHTLAVTFCAHRPNRMCYGNGGATYLSSKRMKNTEVQTLGAYILAAYLVLACYIWKIRNQSFDPDGFSRLNAIDLVEATHMFLCLVSLRL